MTDFQNERARLADLEALLRQKKHDEAIALGTELIEQYPDSFLIRLQLARALKESSSLLRAESVLSVMESRYGDNITFLIERGDLLRRLVRLSDAEKDYQKILFLDPFNSKAKAALDEIQSERKNQSEVAFEVVDYRRAEFKDDQTVPELILKTDEEPEPVAYEPVIDLDAEPDSDPFFNPVDRAAEPDSFDEDKGAAPYFNEEPQVELEERVETENFELEASHPPISTYVDNGVSDNWIQVDIAASGQDTDPQPEIEGQPMQISDLEEDGSFEDEDPPVLESEMESESSDLSSQNHEMGFVTESAAKLYAQQGLYTEALAIYERLGQISYPEKYSHQVDKIKHKISAERQLVYFKKLLTHMTADRGSYFV